MDRQDDPTIDGDLSFFRRIPPFGDRVTWDEHGNPSPSSQNFKDKEDELSVFLEKETTADAVLAGHADFGVVSFTAQKVREIFRQFNSTVIICHDQLDPTPGHVLICGKVTGGM